MVPLRFERGYSDDGDVSMILGLAFAAAILGQAVPAIRWDRIWEQPGVGTIYVDRASVSGADDLRSVSTRTVYIDPLPEGYIAERVRTEEFDCVGRRSRVRRVTIVANDRRTPETIDWVPGQSEWLSNEPGTLGSTKYEIACATTRDHAPKRPS